MPIAGKGMLLTSMDIDPEHEADFNRWYDHEHLEERVAIEGFVEARRYVAEEGTPKYLCLYSTEAIEVLDSPAYKTRLGPIHIQDSHSRKMLNQCVLKLFDSERTDGCEAV